MTSFKDCCDNGCRSQVGNDGFGGFRSGAFQLLPGPDPAGFRNIGSFLNPSGTIRGTVYANLNGDIVGRLSGKIDGLSGLLGCIGNLGNFGNYGLSLPFSVQFGNRTM